jgi:hypothetical protein
MLLIQSFCVSQVEVIRAVDRVKGRKRAIRAKDVDSGPYIDEKAEEARTGDSEAVEELVAVLGIKRSNWTGDKRFANDLLGLPEENMEAIVNDVLGRQR